MEHGGSAGSPLAVHCVYGGRRLYIIAMGWGQPAAWVGLLALIPLVSLLVTGLHLFVLPYAIKWRYGRRVAG